MGNYLPDFCVCKEREGKKKSKVKPKLTIMDNNISIIDYTGLIPKTRSYFDLKNQSEGFIIYEISCVRSSVSFSKHSDVRIKCFGPDMKLIFIKISFIANSRAIVRCFKLFEEGSDGALQYSFKQDSKVNSEGNLKNILLFIEESRGKISEDGNLGKGLYYYTKKLMSDKDV